EIDLGCGFRDGVGRTRLVFEHGHFTENIPRRDLRKDVPGIFRNQDRNLDYTVLNDENPIALITFVKNLLPGCKAAFLSDAAQGCQLLRRKFTKKRTGLERNHGLTLIKTSKR